MNTTKCFIKLTLLLTCLFTVFNTFSQEYNYIHYDAKDGLAGTTVYDICQDKDGFIWFATEAGVSRFDGTHFKNFNTADGLPDTEILRLFADEEGRVWMSPFKNTVCYYYKGKIYTQQTDPHLRKITLPSFANVFMESIDHHIAILVGNDIIDIHPDSTISIFHVPPTRRNAWMFPNPTGPGFNIGYNDTFYTLIKGVMKVVPFIPQPERINPALARNRAHIRALSDDYSRYMKNIIFSNTSDGSWMLDTLTYKRYVERFLKGKQVSHVLIDREKNIWFTTLGEGVFKLASREFKTYFFKNKRSPEIFSLAKYDGKIYAGSRFGRIYVLNGTRLDTLNYDKEFPKSDNASSINRIVNLFAGSHALIGCGDAMLIAESATKGRVVNTHIYPIKSVDEVNDTTILVGTGRSVSLVNAINLLPTDTLWPQRASAVCYYNNEYYIGTTDGLYVISKNKSIRFPGNTYTGLSQRISCFAKSPDGSLWIATFGAGVIHMNAKGIINQLTTAQGLSSNICRSMVLQGNFLWVGTDKGLNKVNVSQTPFPVTVYSTTDGLPSDIINAVYADGNKVYVGSSVGLTFFDETQIHDYSKCDLHILDITVGNKSQPLKDSYLIHYNENGLKISYAGISFRSGGNISYRYRLKGLSNDWDSTTQNALEYPSLPPGKYQFEIIAINKKGVVSNLVHIPFIVEAAFWQTLPFQISVIALFVLVTWILVAWRFRVLRKREQDKMTVQQRLNDLEQMALRAQMNPHFIFNCLNSIQNFIITNNLEASNWYLTEFAHLIRQTMDNSEKNTISITNEIKYLERYLELEMMRFGHSFKYSIETDPHIDCNMVSIPTMILQPYIENSIRHGMRYKEKGDGVIQIKFVKSNNDLLCIIQDNGIGRKKATDYKSRMHIQYQSKGMSLTAERINILNRQMINPITIEVIDLTNEQNEPAGTKVIIRFPGIVNQNL